VRVESERQLLERDHWSWVREVRRDRLFLGGWLGLLIFRYDGRRQDAERLVVGFDDLGRVAAIGRGPAP
jgi:hypothetical protein